MISSRPFVSLTSDFAVQSQGVGTMEATVYSICPDAIVLHLMHGLPEFNITAAARTMETVRYIQTGAHVCVCDPGVGTSRKAIAIKVLRGDYLIGPDNGVLIPATRVLGGIRLVHELSNPEYMRQPVSPIFHGRDIFAPAAAYLSRGVALTEFGKELDRSSLHPAPYEEAKVKDTTIEAKVIQINKFGSLHLNITHEAWDGLNLKLGAKVKLRTSTNELELIVGEKFGDVPQGQSLIMKDDYGRVEIATNLGSFAKTYKFQIGSEFTIERLKS